MSLDLNLNCVAFLAKTTIILCDLCKRKSKIKQYTFSEYPNPIVSDDDDDDM